MRYLLFKDGAVIARSDDLSDLISGNWSLIRSSWKCSFVVKDTAKNVKWHTWSAHWEDGIGGVVIQPIN